MNDEMLDLLKENIRLTRENNRLLHKLWGAEVFGLWAKVIFVLIMIGIPVLIYQYYLADVLQDTYDTYQSLMISAENVQTTAEKFSVSSVVQALEQLGAKVVE